MPTGTNSSSETLFTQGEFIVGRFSNCSLTQYTHFTNLITAHSRARRFPGGESYSDAINRLESVVIDMEQQLGPSVVVSHVSVLQVLMSYFRNSPIDECTNIEVPIHTVFKFVPLRGGGWLESQHPLLPEDMTPKSTPDSPSSVKEPIWGDKASCVPR